ncbi:MAG: TIGR00296 family protein [Candidatus Helarchaeota archaeon]|nr:TIGR00296 family protein [Candidatus Helarchaeota archaeon]
MYSLKDGEFAIKLAREAVKTFIETQNQIDPPSSFPEQFKEKGGIFVTLKTMTKKKDKIEKKLRGCIGFPYPTYPLINAIIESAISSATRDSRFHPPFGPGPVKSRELDNIVFEVSILTPPALLEVNNPNEYLKKIKIGRDGLIVEREHYRGLLLPQVPVEWKWDVEEYLKHTCNKAFMPADCWKKQGTKIYTFQAIIFEEIKPLGEVRQKEIGED